jgi:hypothetical protein
MDGETPGRLVLQQTWRNLGVAPCYDSYALRWSLLDQRGDVVTQTLTFPKQPTTLWRPGVPVALADMMSIPPATPPGMYRLAVEMLKPEASEARIQLGLAGQDAQGRYDLGAVRLQRAPRIPDVLYSSSSGTTIAEWQPAPGVSLSQGTDPGTGSGTLHITGRQPGMSWQYASTRVPASPYSHYRLSCWMKVNDIEPGLPPYLKIGINGPDRWITNLNTNQYDLDRMGTWQLLEADGDTPPDAATLDLAVERGVFEPAITADIEVRDVTLTLLEAP